MTLHFKVWMAAMGQYSWEDIFYNKPKEVRRALQEDITAVRYEWGEDIWHRTLMAWMRTLQEIVGVECAGVAVTDMRFLIEMRGLKMAGGKILHIKAADEQANVAPELRGHRSEVELDSPGMLDLRDAYLFNTKESLAFLREGGEEILRRWGWL
jgi:hypothetical protein